MALSREVLAALSDQHVVSQETDKLITRYCTTLRTDKSNAGTAITFLKQYTLWLRSRGLDLQESNMAVLERYTDLLNTCGFTLSRKADRLLRIVKFLDWCKHHNFLVWDSAGKPLSKDDLLSRAPFNVEPEPPSPGVYKTAADALARGTVERGFAIFRQNGASYAAFTQLPIKDLNLHSRLRITFPGGVIETPEFADRQDVLAFLNKEAKLNLTEPLPSHIQARAVFARSGTVAAAMNGRYDALIKIVAVYATTQDPDVALFAELHAPSRGNRYKKCKWLSAGRQALAAVGRMSSSQIVALYRERLPW
jgi:hypothetical protein